MDPGILLSFLLVYFGILVGIGFWTSRKPADNASFFMANRNAKWYVVAFGMIGTALSGVTFISVPGAVGKGAFGYFQFVLGNAVGFVVIATVLLPLYYRLQLTSIYTYLENRFGMYSYKAGAVIFLVSRTIGSAFRLYLVVIILQRFIFDAWGVPMPVTVIFCLFLIWFYTHKGGLKTILVTDLLQTFFLVSAVILSIYFIADSLDLTWTTAFHAIRESGYARVFVWDDFWGSKSNFWKQFIGGVFVTIAMTGLDQDLMQKNLSMKTIREAQTNMFTFTGVFVVINIFFLCVGALLYIYAGAHGIDIQAMPTPDHLYPEIALNHLDLVPAVVFMLGLTAATFATTDSALTALTTSFCIDILHFNKKEDPGNARLIMVRNQVHIGFSVLLLLIIMVFDFLNNDSVVVAIFVAAGYTYGPLLGLFTFGILSKRRAADRLVPAICLLSPFICYALKQWLIEPYTGYQIGFELIVYNATITWLLLIATSRPANKI
jgi:Na+/proline symporter